MPEPAISRVLSGAIIHLGRLSPAASSNLPGSPLGTDGADESAYSPIWSCSGRGLPCRERLPVARCALTAPFHPYRAGRERPARRYIFCGTFRRLAPPRGYLAPCPKEPGLSSTRIRAAIAWPTPTFPAPILPASRCPGATFWRRATSGRPRCAAPLLPSLRSRPPAAPAVPPRARLRAHLQLPGSRRPRRRPRQ
jgi:hypothetical protein